MIMLLGVGWLVVLRRRAGEGGGLVHGIILLSCTRKELINVNSS